MSTSIPVTKALIDTRMLYRHWRRYDFGVSGFVSTFCNTSTVTTGNGTSTVTLIQPSPPTHTFSGVVRDSTGTPVPGMVVTLDGTTIRTQADGRFSITKDPGRYRLSLRGGGPASGPLNVPGLPDGFTISGLGDEVDLTTNDLITDIVLPPAVTVTANIKDANGNAAPNVRLSFTGHLSDHPTLTGSSHAFTIDQTSDFGDYKSDPSGTATFKVFRNTILPASNGVCATFTLSPRTACITAPLTTTDDVSITLTQQPLIPVYTFAGTVRDADHRPVPTVSVGLGNNAVRTDANGSFSFTQDRGTYDFTVRGGAAAGPLTAPGLPGFFVFHQAGVSLTSDTQQNLQFPAGTTAAVTVKNVDGSPLPNARVTLEGRFPNGYPLVVGAPATFTGDVTADDQTDGQGNFVTTVFRGLSFAPGKICVTHGSFHQCNATTLDTADGALNLIFQQQPPIPAAPTGLSATSPTNAPPAVSWNPVPGATSYLVYRDNVLLGSTSNTNFTDTGLTHDGSFTYAVAASNIGGIGTRSTPLTVIYETAVPAIIGTPDRPANEAGWYRAPVTITWSSTDPAPSSGPPTIPGPTVVTAEGANQVITSEPSCDPAGNCATGQHTLSIDTTPPTITAQAVPSPNSDGWNNQDVTITFACTDVLSGIADCAPPITLADEGNGQSASGTSRDRAGNTASAVATGIKIDKTPPALAIPNWNTNPKPASTATQPVTTTLSVPVTDALSGVQGGEYFVGTDPGIGQATAMTRLDGVLTTTLGANLSVGVHDVGIRARDAAGNWSAVTSSMLVVFDPAGAGITGKNKKNLIPSLANGDVLPGLSQNSQTDPADYGFTVDFRNGTLDPRNDFHFSYTTGTHCQTQNPINCHQLTLDATTFDWLVVDQANNSRGHFQGTATVTVDGVTTTNPFTVEGIDGDRLTPTSDDRLVLRVYAPNSSPSNPTRIYQASGSIVKGNSIRIR